MTPYIVDLHPVLSAVAQIEDVYEIYQIAPLRVIIGELLIDRYAPSTLTSIYANRTSIEVIKLQSHFTLIDRYVCEHLNNIIGGNHHSMNIAFTRWVTCSAILLYTKETR